MSRVLRPVLVLLCCFGSTLRVVFAGQERDLVVRRAEADELEASAALDVGKALALARDSDPAVRERALIQLARADLGARQLEERIQALSRAAQSDADAPVRARALQCLGRVSDERALAALEHVAAQLGGSERREALASIAKHAHGRSWIAARLPVLEALDADVLSAWLPTYARALAEREGGGASAAERAPIVLGLRHVDPSARRAAQLAFEALFTRLAQVGARARMLPLLEGFAGQGVDAHVVAYQSARLALLDGDAAAALASCARLERSLPGAFGAQGGNAAEWRARTLQLRAVVHSARDEKELAATELAALGELCQSALAARGDRGTRPERARHVEWLRAAALCELTRAFTLVGNAFDALGQGDALAQAQPELLACLTRAHALSLEEQWCAVRGDIDIGNGWDRVLGHELSPVELVLDVARHPHWPAARSHAVRLALGRALASVAEHEVIGFVPLDGAPRELGDPARDARRSTLLKKLLTAQREDASRRRSELELELFRAEQRPEGADQALRMERLRYAFEESRLLEDELAVGDGELAPLAELRVPSAYALWAGRALRDDGRSAESRAVLERARDQLVADEVAQRYLWGLEYQAELESSIGASWTDENEPRRAEVELLRAVERLEALEKLLVERDFGPLAIARMQSLRAGALTSLAVNANVKQRDPKRATEYFERAFEIRQDDYMRVLLACYRARAERFDEARELLRGIVPGPGVDYNLACTYALLNDKERALEALARELANNQDSPGARARQIAWARTDPDLDSLHGDARFEALLSKQ